MIRSILLGAASTIFVTPLVIDVALAAERRGAVGALAPQPLVVAPDRPGTGTGTVVYATSSIKCGNTIYEVKVEGGSCSVSGPVNGPNNDVQCTGDKGTGSAAATCAHGCGATSGAGSCTIKSAN